MTSPVNLAVLPGGGVHDGGAVELLCDAVQNACRCSTTTPSHPRTRCCTYSTLNVPSLMSSSREQEMISANVNESSGCWVVHAAHQHGGEQVGQGSLPGCQHALPLRIQLRRPQIVQGLQAHSMTSSATAGQLQTRFQIRIPALVRAHPAASAEPAQPAPNHAGMMSSRCHHVM